LPEGEKSVKTSIKDNAKFLIIPFNAFKINVNQAKVKGILETAIAPARPCRPFTYENTR
jgi:hypothetical protein